MDQELEPCGLRVVRDTDDWNVYVRFKRAGEDAMQMLWRRYARLRKVTAHNGGRSLKTVVAELREYLVGGEPTTASLRRWINGPPPVEAGPTPAAGVRPDGVLRATSHGGRSTHPRRWGRTARHPALSIALSGPFFDRRGVPRRAACPQPPEPADADPHVRWCGRESWQRPTYVYFSILLDPRVRPITEGRLLRLLTTTECHPFLLFEVNFHRRELRLRMGPIAKRLRVDRPHDTNRQCLDPLRQCRASVAQSPA